MILTGLEPVTSTPKVIVRILWNSNIKIKLDAYSHVLPIMQLESVRKISKMIFD